MQVPVTVSLPGQTYAANAEIGVNSFAGVPSLLVGPTNVGNLSAPSLWLVTLATEPSFPSLESALTQFAQSAGVVSWTGADDSSSYLADFTTNSFAPVPEPASWLTFALGLVGLSAVAIRRR